MEFIYTAQAVRQLQTLDRGEQKRIGQKMRFFADQPDPMIYAKPLSGYHGIYRFRIGALRVVFEVSGTKAYVLLIAPRDSVYKGL